jgi:hypothetical protein
LAADFTTEIRNGVLKNLWNAMYHKFKKDEQQKGNTQWNGKELKESQNYYGKVV